MKYEIAGIKFKTKADIKNYIRELISKYHECDILEDDDHEFILEVLNMHPDAENKIGEGVHCFFVMTDKSRTNNKYFKIFRTDKTSIDFSWVKCIDGCKNIKLKRFTDTCRHEIIGQIIKFRDKHLQGDYIMHENGTLIKKEDAHIDHVYEFRKIVKDFIKETGTNIDEIEIIDTKDGLYKEFMCQPYTLLWRDYHKKHAKLRVITKHENLTRKK